MSFAVSVDLKLLMKLYFTVFKVSSVSIYEETSQRHLSGHLKAFIFLGF